MGTIRSIIANAVAQRSYLQSGNIQVALFDNRLEITVPGMLLDDVTIPKIIAGYSKPSNPAIVQAFYYMKIMKNREIGSPELIKDCKEYGLPKQELLDYSGDLRINIFRKVEEK